MRLTNLISLTISLLLLTNLIGCNFTNSKNTQPVLKNTENIRTKNIKAVDDMINNCNIVLDKNRAIIVTALVSIDDLTKSSTLGRMSAEIIANRLAQHGYNVKEIKMNKNSIYIRKKEGEFVLSRKIKEVANKYDVQGIVVGTYAYGGKYYNQDVVNICLRIVEPVTNRIGCSKCYSIKGYSKEKWQ